jgi:hypothetical protein
MAMWLAYDVTSYFILIYVDGWTKKSRSDAKYLYTQKGFHE